MRISDEARVLLTRRFEVLLPHLNERQRRLALATEARLLGHGGVRLVARAAGASETTVRRGVFELEGGTGPLPEGRVRQAGGGRMRVEDVDRELVPALLALVEPDERGDPMSPLRWTTKSLRNLAEELTRQGHPVSAPTVGRLLKEQGFSLQASAKTLEGKQHPDRDAQFRYLNEQVKEHQSAGQPVISIDAKKKEQLGQLPNPGRQWRPAGDPVQVEDHSFYFIGPDVDVAIPFGIYDLANDSGWVNVGTDHDTSVFAVESIRRWWQARGRADYPDANRLLITADCGGSNSYRYRLWKAELAAFAAQTGLTVTVCHFPPGTSKWNKIEHRLFSHITMNWRGRPLTSYEVVVNSIAATRTRTGLRVHAELDAGAYPVGISVSRDHLRSLPITPHDQHGSWNYTIAAAGAEDGSQVSPSDRDRTRAQVLTMLTDPRLSGMTASELDTLRNQLAPAQAAQAEQRKFQQRGGRRLQAPGAHGRPLLSNADRVLITVIYLRRVCSQKVLVDLLAINAVTIGKVIGETRTLMDAQKITVTQTTHYFSSARELRDWAEGGATTSRMELSQALSHPALTGMPRSDLQALIDRITLPYQAALEERRHRQRGGDRRPGTRGGLFRQKITDADRILATVLSQRGLCDQQALAAVFGVSRGTIRNAIEDVQPLLDQDQYVVTPAERRFATAADVLKFVAERGETPC
ncbi:ISAzo13 family transposase [Streptomyces sp. NEAU-W12]|uniref:ISAzo13 family transposase n=1 Tax=Streptomyces sp. NEAU-W12 TaxID=2994668 RepID=UPI00224A74CF|nr:ISAzo13 family transposase [Streptomyces sp. NEAU-W12]MCX2927967.1 ISAzo13 family transposase [Streptomyces sp. NEAU-W12]